jgi:hypothetical protein
VASRRIAATSASRQQHAPPAGLLRLRRCGLTQSRILPRCGDGHCPLAREELLTIRRDRQWLPPGMSARVIRPPSTSTGTGPARMWAKPSRVAGAAPGNFDLPTAPGNFALAGLGALLRERP